MCMQMKREMPKTTNSSATFQLLLHDPMTPSASATPRRSPRGLRAVSRRRRRRNAASARTPLVGASATARARALAAGLWRLRHAERQAVGPAAWRHDRPYIFGSHDPCKLPHVHYARAAPHATVVLEAELEKARARISELEDEKRVMRKKHERFLRKLAEEKALWKSRAREKARYLIAALKEDVKMERKHRRQLEADNTKLMNELAEAKLSAKQFAKSYEMERKARELMEDACDELTKEDRAEVELLRRECMSMREEIEEERRMLQMAEVWREERVQMKLSDAKVALEHKYSQLDRLQAEMESFLRKDGKSDASNSALREARMMSEAASPVRLRFRHVKEIFHHQNPRAREDVDDLVFRRRESANGRYSPASPASNVHSVSASPSPATDIFLEKLDADGSVDLENDSGWETPHLPYRRRDSCASVGTSDPSVARASLPHGKGWDGSGVTEVHSGKNTALVRRLWRSAISESRKKGGSGRSGRTPSSDRRSTSVTPALPVAEQCSSSDSVKLQRTREPKGCDGLPRGGAHKQSLKEKLMEARMDDMVVRS